jgi:hypothetical protein
VARLGAADAPALLVLSSACHGVEGFCGSGAQVALLGDASFHAAVRQSGTAVLFVHALNPYGFSWWRRTTHENVDLNRNFHDFSQPLPANATGVQWTQSKFGHFTQFSNVPGQPTICQGETPIR